MIWKSKRSRSIQSNTRTKNVKRRMLTSEKLESRRLFAADPIHVGVVYIETDYLESDQDVGSDSRGDRFILSFTGGAAGTELNELRIRTDKDNDGISVGDLIYDTELGGRGKNGAHNFQIVRILTADGHTVEATAEVEDGGQELVLRLSGFRAGDRLEFSIDVDEVLRNLPDLDQFNSRLDVIASGQEFQDSILEATFNAPHYETSHADAVFLNDYGDPAKDHNLNLPPDEGTGADSRPNRSAAAVATTGQIAKPISIAGQVWLDNNLNKTRDAGESAVAGVTITLFKWDEATNRYVDTGHHTTTDGDGQYVFPRALGLVPGRYRIVETQPDGLFSVGAIPGAVDGVASGRVESIDVLADIDIPLGDTDAVRYDFAEAQAASVSGYVYRDDNNDGHKDVGETGIAGVRVQLVPINTISAQSAVTVTTAADGSYSFNGLAPGTYKVIEVDQPGYLNDGLDTPGTINGRVVGRAENPGDAIHDIVLAGASDGVNYNFGETPFGSITGFVYLVAPGEDCEGPHDAPGNKPLEGVRVVLQDSFGTIIAETRTAADGSYEFDELPIGNYRIVEYTPAGLLDGGAHVGVVDGSASGTAVGGGLIQEITMTANGRGVEYNFCEIAPATISGYVYHDRSDDGKRDGGEEGIAGTTVSLIDTSGKVVATAVTDVNGRYEFKGIVPGVYRLLESQPNNYYDGKDAVGTVSGTRVGQLGNDGDSLVDIELKQGQGGVEYNFGELVGATLSGRVHVDADDDCDYDEGEITPSGVVIRLIDVNGNEVARTTTNAEGKYSFTNIAPGEYTVIEGVVDGYFEGTSHAGSAGGVADPPNRISKITLASAEVAVDYDFCERPPAEISGVVYDDRDNDNRRDTGEAGIGNVLVELFNSDGEKVASTRTDANGAYRFTYLPAGSYTVREMQPTGWLQGGQQAGSGGGNDSVDDVISSIPIGWGDRLTQYNFGELMPGSISGVVYVDSNGDCVRDPDEAPIAGVMIELRDGNGQVLGRTTTNVNGQYSFEGLRPGEYQIFEEQPDGFFQGGQVVGSGGGVVLDQDLLGMTLMAGANIVDYDFCELPPGSISGVVYIDADGNFQRDTGESPIRGVKIELRNEKGVIVATTVTDANGRYLFEGLAPGNYQIFEQQPTGFFQGAQHIGSGGGTIISQDLTGLKLSAGNDVVDYNFGELPPGSISGVVYIDADADFQRDSAEATIAGVKVDLRDGNGNVVATTVTDANGRYRFEGLAPGDYQIFEHQPAGYYQGGQHIGSGGGNILGADLTGLKLATGRNVVDYDFGELLPGSISGYVHVDSNGNCTYEEGEKPIAGVRVELRDEEGNRIAETTTDASGLYRFGNLPPGRYHIVEIQPDGFFQGGQSIGSGGGEVIGDDHLALDLLAGANVVHYDFCEREPSTISGSVWKETDLDRVFNSGDIPLGNILIELLDEVGNRIAQTRTDAFGNYEFNNLAPGIYSVHEHQPVDLFDGGALPGSAGGTVTGDDLISGIKLTGGTNAVDYDFPEVPPATISGYVFQDGSAIPANTPPNAEDLRDYKDGLLTDDDLRIGGVTLELRNVLGEAFTSDRALAGVYPDGVIRVTTDEFGFYEFTGLRPGTYSVYQVQPDNFIDGLDTAGSTGGVAVNPADVLDQDDAIRIQTLALSEATDPRDDAILFINLGAGGSSRSNNFSEIAITEPAIPQLIEDPIEDIKVYAPIETFDPSIRLVGFGEIQSIRRPMIADDEWAVSWHLSVINGGFPGGSAQDGSAVIKTVGATSMQENWTEGEHTSGRWVIVNADGEMMEIANRLTMGEKDAVALTGDFDGDGKDEAVLFVNGHWFVDLNGDGRWDEGDMWIKLGTELDRPVVGDWDGDGKDDVAIFGRQWHRDPQRIKKDPGLPDPENRRRRELSAAELAKHVDDRGEDRERFLRRGNDGNLRADAVDHVFQYGEQVDTPIAGDWNGDGIDQIAVFRGGTWMLDTDGDGRWTRNDEKVEFGRAGDEPIVGDFNGDGIDEIGVVRGDVWIIDTDGDRKITSNDLQIEVPRPSGDSQPVVGDWDGDGRDEAGYYDEAA